MTRGKICGLNCICTFYFFFLFSFFFFFLCACFSICSSIFLKSNDICDRNYDFVAKNVNRFRGIERTKYIRRRCNLTNLNL